MGSRNKGYITVEASLVVPLFLFFMLGMSGLYMVLLTEAHIHQALASAVDYVAQHSYLEQKLLDDKTRQEEGETTKKLQKIDKLVDYTVLRQKFNYYLGESTYINRVVVGGKNGISLQVTADADNKKIMVVTATYFIKVALPLLGTYSIHMSNQIKQKTFVGFSKEEYMGDDYYVYVTPNREAYHLRRDCTHLVLDIRTVSANKRKAYVPCCYCGTTQNGNKIYVTKENEIYHSTKDCVGLKRTVSRVKISTVKGIGVCSRCGE